MNAAWESLFDGSLTLTDTHTESSALAGLPACRGVLLFTDAHNQPIQLIQTANLRGLSRSRLADCEALPRRKADLSAITCHIYYACCANDFQRHLLYQRLTHALFGKDWKTWLALPRRDYAAIDRSRAFPHFSVCGFADGVDWFGPFPNRRAAGRFCECLNSAFELCRNPALLDSGNRQSCPYLQMQSCHGLCCQEHGQRAYAALVEKAVRCAEGHRADGVAEIEERMHQAAADLKFEAAQLRKKQADRLKELLRSDYEWTGRLRDLRIWFVGQGEKIAPEGTKKKVQQYQLWMIDVSGAYPVGTFGQEDADTLQSLLQAEPSASYPYAQSRQEHLATVGWFLYRKSRPGLWYNAAAATPAAEQVLSDLAETSAPHQTSRSS